MSVSIIKSDQLWGLISCHHETARFVPYNVRMACEFLGQILSLQLAAKEDFENYAYEVKINAIQTHLLENMLSYESVIEGLIHDKAALLDVVGAHGAVLCYNDKYIVVGHGPQEQEGRRIVAWLKNEVQDDVFITDTLPFTWQEAQGYQEIASGLLAISISRVEGNYLMWFRPEVIQEVTWSGDPNKSVVMQDGTMQLHPRTSFAAWKQIVRGRSQPWKKYEIDAARIVRGSIIDRVFRDLVLQRADDLARLNEKLAQSNSELDSFASITSHDLKEPLRGIHNYALILKEDYGDRLDEEGRERMDTIVKLTLRMGDLMDSLLHYSRVGSLELSFAETDLQKIVGRVLELLSLRLEASGVQVRIPRPLPTIWCDRVRVSEIYNNLITNALKYNDKQERWIEIGYIDPSEGKSVQDLEAEPVVFYVRDNGIGMREKYFDVIFRIFKRLHGRTKFGGGTGAGLTIVKRIVERHSGRIWVESVYGEGTTFYFTLEKGKRP